MDYLLEGILALMGGMTLLQLTPIKVDPWTWLGRKIGRAVNGELLDRMEKLESMVKMMEETSSEQAAKSTRIRILRFGDEILHGTHHSKEHFDQILQDITEYEQYCREHPNLINNMTVLTTKHIMEVYSACFEDNNFL